MKNPLVSVIIPTYNEEIDIETCIGSVFNQSQKNLELIIVDDGSTDSTVRKVKTHKEIKLIKGQHKGPGFSRNLGAKKAKGKILVFIDADMILDKDYIKHLIKPILHKETIGAEDGYQLASNKDNIWSRCWGQYTKSPEKAKRAYQGKEYIKGQIFRAILTSEFRKMGGFDPNLGYADDLTFYLKHGKTSLRVKEAFCYHKNPETLRQVYKQSRWIGASFTKTKLRSKGAQKLAPLLLFIAAPLAIPFLTLRKCYKNKDVSTLPFMPFFIATRYLGTITGLINAAYRNINTR